MSSAPRPYPSRRDLRTTPGTGRPPRHRRPAVPRWKDPVRWAAVLLPVGVAATTSWLGAYAAFTDAVATSSSFSAGTVQIKANGTATSYAFTSLSVASLVPGATPTYALLTISNTGTVTSAYTMTTAATANQLTTDLRLGIVRIAGATCDAAAYSGGTTVYTEAANLSLAAVSSRTLTAGASENLCFKVALPVTSGNSSAGLTSNATFTFAATT